MPTALVTGASRGIGLALLAELAARGYDAIGTARTPARTPARAAGTLSLDLLDPASIARAAETFGLRLLDLLVCNAGVYLDDKRTASPVSPATLWAESFAVNVTGVFLTVEAFLPALRLSQAPRIAVISSRMGSTARAPGGSLAYRASKAAAVNLGRNLAADLAREGIALGIYHPGWVRTDMGGKGAEIDAETSARGLADRFAALGPATTGCFESYDGQTIPF
ncbi:MAG: SDR family NAD(P)-dependent oxidoreductase [Paracoccaceae bacterium]